MLWQDTPIKGVAVEDAQKRANRLPGRIDRAVFPGLQGGPHENQIAALAVALEEAARPAYSEYARQVAKNATVLAEGLLERGFHLVTGGTGNPRILLHTREGKGIPGCGYARGVYGP